jgi:hypothetical protein
MHKGEEGLWAVPVLAGMEPVDVVDSKSRLEGCKKVSNVPPWVAENQPYWKVQVVL